jgi:ligand-binding sensor domain-containing protein
MGNMDAKIEVDNSFENYVKPEESGTEVISKEEAFVNAVEQAAKQFGVDYFVATRKGLFRYDAGDSEVLKAIAAYAWEINNKPENIPMNN